MISILFKKTSVGRQPGIPQLFQIHLLSRPRNVHHRFLDAYFVPGFYKKVLNKVNLEDLKAVDYELHKGCIDVVHAHFVSISSHSLLVLVNAVCRGNNIMDVLEETISVTEDRFGEHIVFDLRPGGSSQDPTMTSTSRAPHDVPHYRAVPRILGGPRSRPRIRFIARLRLVRARPVDWRHVGDRHGRWDALYGI